MQESVENAGGQTNDEKYPGVNVVKVVLEGLDGSDILQGVREAIVGFDSIMKAVFSGPDGWVSLAIKAVDKLMGAFSGESEESQVFNREAKKGIEAVESTFQYGETEVGAMERRLTELLEAGDILSQTGIDRETAESIRNAIFRLRSVP